MNSKEYLYLLDIQKERISEKYGNFMYYLISNIFNINSISKTIETVSGYKTERVIVDNIAFDDILYNNKIIGKIECIGSFPNIVFQKGCRYHAKKFIKYAIEPIIGLHRILEWHDIREKKMHCLAGGQTVLHFLPLDITNEEIDNFIKKLKLEPLVEESLKN